MPIYTIGKGRRDISEFVALLKLMEIDLLIDLRTPSRLFNASPYGKRHFRGHLFKNQIGYHFLGDLLGSIQDNPDCLDENGQLNFTRYQRSASFQTGIRRLVRLAGSVEDVMLFGAPGRPSRCHRFHLIVTYLREAGFEVKTPSFTAHIGDDNEPYSHEEVEDRIIDFYFREKSWRYERPRHELLRMAYRRANRDMGWRP